MLTWPETILAAFGFALIIAIYGGAVLILHLAV
jgi:hypothetical protein